jgi:hypothetical protein
MAAITGDGFQTRQRAISPVISAEGLLRVALWSILIAAAASTTTDPDLWGHVRFGLDMLGGSGIPSSDPYSFTSDRPWINHEWLAEVMMGAAYRIGGDFSLILLKLTLMGGIVWLLTVRLRRDGINSAVVRDTAVAVALILTIEQTRHVRPQLFSLLCFAAMIFCLTSSRNSSNQSLFVLPPLFAVWANLHGGWLVGGGILAVWAVSGALASGREFALRLLVGLASAAATLLTPYHIHLWSFLRDTVGFSRADIVEWQPVYALGWLACVRWIATASLGAVGLIVSIRRERLAERAAYLLALASASLMVARLEGFFAIAVLFLVGADVGRACGRLHGPTSGTPRNRVPVAIAALAGVVMASALIITNVSGLRIDPRLTPDAGAVRFLEAAPPGRLLVWFDWGEYAIWHLAPGMRVSIDGRRETAYSEDLQQRHLRFYFDAPGGSALPSALAADYVWIPRTIPAVHRLDADGWTRLYEDGQSIVFGHPLARPSRPIDVVAAARTDVRMFPGP